MTNPQDEAVGTSEKDPLIDELQQETGRGGA